jgi:hypothetical protein
VSRADIGQGVGEVVAHHLVGLVAWITEIRQVRLPVVAREVQQRGSGVFVVFTVTHRESVQCRSCLAHSGSVRRRRLDHGADVPRLFCSDTDRDGDFDGAVPDPRVVAEAWGAWRAEVDFATWFVAEAPSLDITGNDPLNQHGSGGGPMSLREVLVGMIDEYARHLGHPDLLRERIDGRVGQ